MTARPLSEKLFDALLYALLACIVFIVVYPFIHVLSVSFSDRAEAIRAGFHFFPRSVSLDAYAQVLQASNIWIGYGNTAYRMAFGTALTMIVTVLAAYPLSKAYFPWRRGITMLILFTMIFEGGMIPTYLLFKELGLLNTRGAYVFPYAANPFYVLVMMSFFRSIPKELEESARIDGASETKTLLRIVLPLTIPVLVTLCLWALVFHLNYFTDNLLYVTDRSKFVLQQVLREILIEDRQDSFSMVEMAEEPPASESLKMAAIVVSILPMAAVYPFLLKYFEKGLMVGSVKG